MIKLARNLFSALSAKEKTYLFIWSGIKFVLSLLDILGLLALGLIFQKIQLNSSAAPTSEVPGFEFFLSMSVYQLGLLSISFFIVKIAISVFVNFGIARFVQNIEIRKSVNAFRGLLTANLEVTESMGEKKLIHGLLTATHNAYGATLLSYFIILGEISLITAIAFYLAAVNILLFALISIIFIGLTLVSNSAIGRQISKYARSGDLLLINASTFISDALKNKRQIVSHGVIENFVSEFEPRRRHMASTSNRLIVFTTLPRYALEITLLIGLVVLSAPLANKSILNLDPETLATFAMGLFRIVGSMLPLQNQLNLLRRIYEEAASSFEIESSLKAPLPDVSTPSNSVRSIRKPWEIRLSGVTYTYPDAESDALRDVSATIKSGELIALVGKSGSGKSTFADIITGLRSPKTGSRRIVSKNRLLDSNLSFGYVPQKVTLFSGSLSQNIAMTFDNKLIDEDRLTSSLKAANLGKLISHLPDGAKTIVDDSNRGLSGGEVQRVGIARALYAGADVLVMDESTSALDKSSEDAILETLQKLKGSLTIVLIAHREKTISIANKVLTFENGQIVDSINRRTSSKD